MKVFKDMKMHDFYNNSCEDKYCKISSKIILIKVTIFNVLHIIITLDNHIQEKKKYKKINQHQNSVNEHDMIYIVHLRSFPT